MIKYPATVEALGAIRKNRKYHELLTARKKVGVKDMRDIEDIWFEQGEKQGEKRGEKRGESRLSQLINLLFEQNRAEDVKRIANDKDYRNLLYKEFNIL